MMMKLYIAIACALLVCSLSAQTKNNSPAIPDATGNKVMVTGGVIKSAPQTAPPVPETRIDPLKEADIRRLLEIMRANELVAKLIAGMEQGIKPMVTNALPSGEYRERLVNLFFAKFHSKMQSNDMIELLVPIYDKYYTREDINGLIQFYETPLGKKMVSVTPQVAADSQAAGREWGQQLGSDSMHEVLSEHPDLEKALEEAKNPFSLPK